MNIDKAIKLLKELHSYTENVKSSINISDEEIEAIDTVVSHYEKSEKIEFLKSAKQPSEITHPYDLSKK